MTDTSAIWIRRKEHADSVILLDLKILQISSSIVE